MTDIKDKTLCERIDAAYAEIAKSKFDKSREVTGGQKYKFIPIDQILDIVRRAHANNGVKVFFGKIEYDADNGEKRWTYEKVSPHDGKKTLWTAATGHVRVKLIGKDPMTDTIETIVSCEAQDNSDKLTNKLYTNAERALYRTLYAIDEGYGTDPEATHEEMVIAAEPPKREIKAPRADPFFGKKTTTPKAGANVSDKSSETVKVPSAPANGDLSKADKIDYIMDQCADAHISGMVSNVKEMKGAASIYNLDDATINNLYREIKEGAQ